MRKYLVTFQVSAEKDEQVEHWASVGSTIAGPAEIVGITEITGESQPQRVVDIKRCDPVPRVQHRKVFEQVMSSGLRDSLAQQRWICADCFWEGHDVCLMNADGTPVLARREGTETYEQLLLLKKAAGSYR